ncbi:MAG: transglutaminase domain-containing protein [Bacteroidota bacterium]
MNWNEWNLLKTVFLISVSFIFLSGCLPHSTNPAYVWPSASEHGIILTTDVANPITPDGEVILEFNAPAQTELIASLRQNGLELQKPYQYTERLSGGFRVKAYPPDRGTYNLIIFTRNRMSESFTSSMQFTINAMKAQSVSVTYPMIYSPGYLSSVRPEDPQQGFLRTSDEIHIPVIVPSNIILHATLEPVVGAITKEGQIKKLSQSIFISERPGGVVIDAFPPKRGIYNLNIFGKTKDDTVKNYSGFFRCQIEALTDHDAPKKYPEYFDGEDYIPNYKINAVGNTKPSADYTTIDSIARNVPKIFETSIDSLTEYLVSHATSDLQKLRAIFVWITNNIAYDTDAYFSGDISSAADYKTAFKQRKGVCSGYAGLFSKMSKRARLTVVTISGYAKGYGYETSGNVIPADALTSNHAWNAVRLDSTWYLLDATWGAGSLDHTNRFIKEFKEFFFLTLPKDLMYDHFPEHTQWQLLKTPISRSTFFNLPKHSPNRSVY